MDEGPSRITDVRLGPWLLAVGGTVLAAGAWVLAARGVEPAATWLYPAAWYPVLLALEGIHALRWRRYFVLHRPRAVLSLLAWSVPVWMLFEAVNFRLENWHYVFVPDLRGAAWSGIVLSFATVLPAIFLPAAVLGWGRSPARGRSPPADLEGPGREGTPPLGAGLLRGVQAVGALILLLPLAWPRVFFPLVWGGFLLLADPRVHSQHPERSLLHDVRTRRFGRIGTLLGGGALAGLLWEGLNSGARARWIYTVPGLEEFKLWEMPVAGFLGFPVFALSAFSLYQWLVCRGVAAPVDPAAAEGPEAPPVRGDGPRPTRAGRAAVVLAPILVVGTLLGLERWTIESRTPRLRDLPSLLPSRVEDLSAWGVRSPFELAALEPGEVARIVPGVDPEEARTWIEAARLAVTRGVGTRNARLLTSWGIPDLRALARADAHALRSCFERAGVDAELPLIRAWQRGARSAVGGDPAGSPLVPAC